MKKKLLFISSRPIFPIIGGDQIRTKQQLELLCEHFEVDVLYMTNPGDTVDLKKYMHGIGRVFKVIVPRYKHLLQTLGFFFNTKPLQVNYYRSKKVINLIKRIEGDYDVFFCNNIRTADYVKSCKGMKLLDFVDAISMNYDKARHESTGIKKIIYNIDYKRCKLYEKKCLKIFDACAVISEVDKKYILNER